MNRIVAIGISVLWISVFSTVVIMGQAHTTGNDQKVGLTYVILERTKKKLRVELTLVNNGKQTIYVGTNPRRIDGTPGFYISAAESSNHSITVSSRVFAPLVYSPYSVHHGIELKRLLPNKELKISVILESPLVESIPPTDLPLDLKKCDLEIVKTIRFEFGYFTEDEGLDALLDSKATGWFVNGLERIATGNWAKKRVFEVQEIASVKVDLFRVRD